MSFHAMVRYFDASDSPFLLNNTSEETVLMWNKNCPCIYPISSRYATYSYSKNYAYKCNCAIVYYAARFIFRTIMYHDLPYHAAQCHCDGGYISRRVLHIWTMGVTYLDDCYISGRWVFHIWTTVTHLDDRCYISGRLLPIWTMEVT